MPYVHEFTDPKKNYQHQSGRLYLGAESFETKTEIGIESERHALLIAGAGSGKGAAIIIPNLKKWPHNVLTIDPKGEAAEATAEIRDKKMGQSVHVLDPFKSSKVKKKYRASYNPLADLDPESPTIKEDIDAITDGTVMRPDQSAAHWDDGAQAIISGLVAFVILHGDEDKKNLVEVRRILRDDDAFALAMEQMKNETGCAGLCQDACASAFAKEGGYFVSNARKNTRWLDSKGMEKCLSSSSFSLADLKHGKASVFLVLPANYLSQHGRFLRLFVRCALEKMAEKLPSGELRGEQCLFLLDEFYSLGYIDEISKAAGLMRGYGLQLFPVLQDLGQLITLYGREGSETFFGNADAHIFFGNTDAETLDYVSERIGAIAPTDIQLPPMKSNFEPSFWAGLGDWARNGATAKAHWKKHGIDREKESWAIHEENLMRQYQNDLSYVGKPRMPADRVRELIGKSHGDKVAQSMIVFAKGGDVLNVKLVPYFASLWEKPLPVLDEVDTAEQERQQVSISEHYGDMLARLETEIPAEDFKAVKKVVKKWIKWPEEKRLKYWHPDEKNHLNFPRSIFHHSVDWRYGEWCLSIESNLTQNHNFWLDFSDYTRFEYDSQNTIKGLSSKHLHHLRWVVEKWHGTKWDDKDRKWAVKDGNAIQRYLKWSTRKDHNGKLVLVVAEGADVASNPDAQYSRGEKVRGAVKRSVDSFMDKLAG